MKTLTSNTIEYYFTVNDTELGPSSDPFGAMFKEMRELAKAEKSPLYRRKMIDGDTVQTHVLTGVKGSYFADVRYIRDFTTIFGVDE